MMTIKQTLSNAISRLRDSENPSEAEIDARLLLEYALDCNRAYLLLHENDQIDEQVYKCYQKYIAQRIQGKPIEYIMDTAYFFGYRFKVNEHTLIPRPETEELVAYALSVLDKGREQLIIDVGAGTGCIGVTICKENGKVSCVSIDRSKEALRAAKDNAIENVVDHKIKFVESDLFRELDVGYLGIVDMVISNPPYIRTEDIEGLSTKVKKFEPMLALDGGADGLIFYRRISSEAKKYLKKGGIIIFEVGHDQAEDVMNILKEEQYINILCRKDMFKIDRIVTATI